MRNKNIVKWAVYTIGVILIAVIQATPDCFPKIMGITPLFLLPSVVVIAMAEGETAGAVFGIVAGLLWDLESGRIFGFNAFFLMIIGITVGLLIQYLFRKTIISALFLTLGLTLIHELITWFFFYYVAGYEYFIYSFLHIILPTTAYTFIFSLPLYYGARFVHGKFSRAE